uniref:sn-1-specific diacylglycerol lipase ABHD11 n=1 Tax=Podarcis muralis TaxID=64176 RepID=A0A670K6Q3_PODMU
MREGEKLSISSMPSFPNAALRLFPSHDLSFTSVCSPVPVSYAVFDGPSPEPPLVFLHGLFGSKLTLHPWPRSWCSKLAVLTVDARNHGDSPHSPLMTYEAMSADIHLLLRQLNLSRCVLIGHSMGGKTAMVMALQWPELVERLVCVDISPSETTAISGFQNFIAAMKAVDIPRGIPRSTARRLAEEQLRPAIQEPTIRQFLLTNLVYVEDRFVWRVNLDAISQHLGELMGFPPFQVDYPGLTLFLGGSNSDDYPEIDRLFPEAEIQYVPDAGHWVHADQPQEFIAAICNFLRFLPL